MGSFAVALWRYPLSHPTPGWFEPYNAEDRERAMARAWAGQGGRHAKGEGNRVGGKWAAGWLAGVWENCFVHNSACICSSYLHIPGSLLNIINLEIRMSSSRNCDSIPINRSDRFLIVPLLYCMIFVGFVWDYLGFSSSRF